MGNGPLGSRFQNPPLEFIDIEYFKETSDWNTGPFSVHEDFADCSGSVPKLHTIPEPVLGGFGTVLERVLNNP